MSLPSLGTLLIRNTQLQAETSRTQSLERERDQATGDAQQATTSRQQMATNAQQLRGALEEEQARVAAMTTELSAARRELEDQASLASKAQDETKRLRQAADDTTAGLRRSLQNERDKIASLAHDLAAAQRLIETRTRSDLAPSSPVAQANEGSDTTSAAPKVPENPETIRLMARADALLAQGDIGGARIVLERALETGSAKVSFALAETYDPNVLANWGTYGTRGDASKARELYARATAGGIREARDRINALH